MSGSTYTGKSGVSSGSTFPPYTNDTSYIGGIGLGGAPSTDGGNGLIVITSCKIPTSQPSMQPSSKPTSLPSLQPSSLPTNQPSCQPSLQVYIHFF